ncbi:MAG: methyltransferase domain-containing protein [Bdellovibrionaceae bacterium]|nr:methyltransferase domain-containing protein [Pseudobdellovibrionaceae bacterium]
MQNTASGIQHTLHQRSDLLEQIDGSDFSPQEHEQSLRQLEIINRWTNGYGPTLEAIRYFFARQPSPARPLRILDVGCGYGDTLRAIAKWSARNRKPMELTGIDVQPLCGELAVRQSWRERLRCSSEDHPPIRYLTGNVFEHEPERPYDVIINALFMHHLSNESIVTMLNWMHEHARLGFFINDLHRHRLAYDGIKWLTRLLPCNRLIRHDAPLSVARAFRIGEWRGYLRAAGLRPDRCEVKWHWAFRIGVRYDHEL